MNFSDSALNKLMMTYPDLGKLIVSFRDMKGELDQDSVIDMGVFLIKSGDKYYYVPVISKSGSVYPIDTIFDPYDKQFIPLSKETVNSLINSQSANIGRKVKIDKTINKNPSVRELVEPPRTGKVVYASAGRLPEFLATIPDETKSYLLDKIASDVDLANQINKVYGLTEIVKPLKKLAEVIPAESSKAMGVKVVTEGKGLPEDQIQAILNQGYAIDGELKNARVAIASDPASYVNEFTTINAGVEGRAYSVVFKNGTTRDAVVPPLIAHSEHMGESKSRYGWDDKVFIFNDGSYSTQGKAVILAKEVNYRDVFKDILEFTGCRSIQDVEQDSKVAIFDGAQLVGIFYINQVCADDISMTIRARSDFRPGYATLKVYNNYEGKSQEVFGEYHLSPTCVAIPMSTRRSIDDIETDINAACIRREYEAARVLESTMTLSHDNGVYSMDGSVVGDKPSVMKVLIRKKILPAAGEDFIKRAEEQGHVKVLMSKQAAFSTPGTRPAEIPEYGDKPDPHPVVSGTAEDRALGRSMSSFSTALKTGDKQVIDATLISELLQDPDMGETIQSYLPDIKEAMDKLGRIILMSRMKSDDLSNSMDSDGLTDLLLSLRNTYKVLGENYLKLERLSHHVATES